MVRPAPLLTAKQRANRKDLAKRAECSVTLTFTGSPASVTAFFEPADGFTDYLRNMYVQEEERALGALALRLNGIAVMAAEYRRELVEAHGFTAEAGQVLAARVLNRVQKAEVRRYNEARKG
jgi:hypothetical protein